MLQNRFATASKPGLSISRRGFMLSLGATILSFAVDGITTAKGAGMAGEFGSNFRPNIWINIDAGGDVSVISPSAEMGQGVMTASPLLVAEELEADWSRVKVVQAPADMAYGNPIFGGVQVTGGSATTPGYFTLLRIAGAQARLVLMGSAARLMGVAAIELRADNHRIYHDASGRSLDFAEVVSSGLMPDPIPQATEADLKPAERFRYIGKSDIGRIDVPLKVNGAAVYGIDVEPEGLLFGAVLRAPVQDEAPLTVDDAAARALPGVVAIVSLPYGVGVIADRFDSAVRAKDLLRVTWTDKSRARAYSSESKLEEYRTIAADLTLKGGVAKDDGDAQRAVREAARVIAADYLNDHVYHATLEPMTATAVVTESGAHIWAPTQAQSLTTWVAAGILGMDPAQVTLTTTLAGGGLGRKAEGDFISDAVYLAREVSGRPVKVIWSREDDVRHGKYRVLVAQHARIGLSETGQIVGWDHRLVADSIYARWFPDGFREMNGMDDTVYGGLENNYALKAHRTEYLRQDAGKDVGFWRSTGEGYTKFAVECMIDEAAAVSGQDPLRFRTDMLEHDPRAQAVLEMVAGMAEWSQPRPQGRALGLAYSLAWGGHCAQIAEVSVDRQSGQIRVHQMWCVLDPGIAIQPFNIEAQLMGAIIQGTSAALHEKITVVNGEVQESNFDTYRVLRMSEVPEIHIRVLSTNNPPSGVGEVGVPPVAPAIANAVARLTGGVRLRHMPFLPERVLAAIAE